MLLCLSLQKFVRALVEEPAVMLQELMLKGVEADGFDGWDERLYLSLNLFSKLPPLVVRERHLGGGTSVRE